MRCLNRYLTALVLLTPVAAHPDDVVEADSITEEVLVSALREVREEESSGGITVIDGETLRAPGLGHAQDLVQLVPNMNFSGEGSRARYFQLRGIGELEQYEGAPNPSVGFILDDIDLSGVGGIAALHGIGRVEVLRGPQATRFGANAIGGLIYLQSRDFDDAPSAQFSLGIGNDNHRSIAASMGAALSDAVNSRFSIQQASSDGFHENRSMRVSNSNERDERVARAGFRWQGLAGWEARLSLLSADFDNGYDAWSPGNSRVTYTDHPGRDEQQTTGASLRLQGGLNDAAELVSITGFADSDILFSYDGDWGDAEYWAPYGYDYRYTDQRRRKTLSQEWRLVSTPQGSFLGGRGGWLTGLYFQRLDESNEILSRGIYDDSADAPFSYCQPCQDDSRLFSAYQSTNLSVFGQLDVALTGRLALTAGLRVERWKSDYTDEFRDELQGDPSVPQRHSFSPTENLWGGRFGLNFDISGQARLYTLVSRGYKAGGFNPSFARVLGEDVALDATVIGFGPEALLNFEAGLDGRWLEGALRARLSLFRMDRRNMQVRSSVQYTNNPNDFIFITSNAGGRSTGLEASLQWNPGRRWSLHGELGLLQTRLEDYPLQREADVPGSLEGRDFAHAPDFTLNLGVAYTSAGSAENAWQARLDVHAMAGFYFDYSHDDRADSRRLVSLSLRRTIGHWELSAWVRNLFNEDYHTRGFSFGLEPPFFERRSWTRLGDPRLYGLSMSYRR